MKIKSAWGRIYINLGTLYKKEEWSNLFYKAPDYLFY